MSLSLRSSSSGFRQRRRPKGKLRAKWRKENCSNSIYLWVFFLTLAVFGAIVQIGLFSSRTTTITTTTTTTTVTSSIDDSYYGKFFSATILGDSNNNNNDNRKEKDDTENAQNSNSNSNNPQQQQQQQQQQQYETLWLITCETRAGAKDIHNWQFFANAVRVKNERDKEEKQQRQKEGDHGDPTTTTTTTNNNNNNDNDNLPTVKVKNICEGKEWNGFMTKFQYIFQFLDDLLNNNNKSRHLVIFSDSDAIFNVFGVGIGELLERFHVATTITTTPTGSTKSLPILIGAEPNCWYTGHCSQRALDELFPEASKDRSSCPRYVNSGLYMGEATALRDMLHQILTENETANTNTTTTTTTVSSSPSLIADTMRSLEMPMTDDQGWMMAWYGVYGRGKLAAMDTRAMIFRNMVFGYANANAKGSHTCGPRDARGKGCGFFYVGQYRGATDANTSAIVTQEVPGCFPSMSFSMAKAQNYVTTTTTTTTTTSGSSSVIGTHQKNDNADGGGINRMYYENIPFILHANGATKKVNKYVITEVGQQIKEHALVG